MTVNSSSIVNVCSWKFLAHFFLFQSVQDMLMTSWNQINTYLVFLVNEAWSSVSASSLMFSPREPCLCVKLFPAAVTLAAMAMGMVNVYFLRCGISSAWCRWFIWSLGIYVEEMMAIFQSVRGSSGFSSCPLVYFSS